jgi:hypothetical protein
MAKIAVGKDVETWRFGCGIFVPLEMAFICAFRLHVSTTRQWVWVALIKQVLLYKGLSRCLHQILSCLIGNTRNSDWCHTLISRWPKSAAAMLSVCRPCVWHAVVHSFWRALKSL